MRSEKASDPGDLSGAAPAPPPRELACVPDNHSLGIIDSPVSAAFGGTSGIQVEFPAPCRKSRPKFRPQSHDSVFPRHSCGRQG